MPSIPTLPTPIDRPTTTAPLAQAASTAAWAVAPAMLLVGEAAKLPAADIATYVRLGHLQLLIWGGAFLAWLAAWFFSTLRRSMGQAIEARVLSRVKDAARRRELEPLFERLPALAESASLFETASEILFALLTLFVVSEGRPLDWRGVVAALLITVPALWVATRGLAQAVSLRYGDVWVARLVPGFHALQMPLAWLVYLFRVMRRGLLRVLGLPDDADDKREIVAGLQEVLADAEISGNLDDTEREIIGNVMDFRDVDVAAVMAPRTEMHAVDVDSTLEEAAKVAADSGHSRLPVYSGTLDTIMGTIAAYDLLHALATDRANLTVRSLVQPAFFVPETKRVTELLTEFRARKVKLAIVLDEYGGTAGLVTLGDILSELVGELPDETDSTPESRIVRHADGRIEIDASLHVSKVNEELALDVPETADYETLAGFVLAKLGRFPKRGEAFAHGGTEFTVADASDRRVFKVVARELAIADASSNGATRGD